MKLTTQTARLSAGVKDPSSLASAAARRATKARAGVKAAVKRRYRLGTVFSRDIPTFQRLGDIHIRKLPFQRLVREISQKYTNIRLFWLYRRRRRPTSCASSRTLNCVRFTPTASLRWKGTSSLLAASAASGRSFFHEDVPALGLLQSISSLRDVALKWGEKEGGGGL